MPPTLPPLRHRQGIIRTAQRGEPWRALGRDSRCKFSAMASLIDGQIPLAPLAAREHPNTNKSSSAGARCNSVHSAPGQLCFCQVTSRAVCAHGCSSMDGQAQIASVVAGRSAKLGPKGKVLQRLIPFTLRTPGPALSLVLWVAGFNSQAGLRSIPLFADRTTIEAVRVFTFPYETTWASCPVAHAEWAALSTNILIGWRRPGWPLDHATTRSASLTLETDVLHRRVLRCA